MNQREIKKNILDLHYNKYLQWHNTTIVIAITYGVGITLGFITGQINLHSKIQILSVVASSMAVTASMMFLVKKFRYHLKKIPQEIKKLAQ